MGISVWTNVWHKMRHTAHIAGEVFYGMTTFDWAHRIKRQRAEVVHLFFLVTFGDLMGLPIMPPYYTLRLLPYVLPAISYWKRSLLRQRDWTDLAELIGG